MDRVSSEKSAIFDLYQMLASVGQKRYCIQNSFLFWLVGFEKNKCKQEVFVKLVMHLCVCFSQWFDDDVFITEPNTHVFIGVKLL